MLLVSDYFYTSNTCLSNLKPDTCEPLQYKVYITHLLDLCDINPRTWNKHDKCLYLAMTFT